MKWNKDSQEDVSVDDICSHMKDTGGGENFKVKAPDVIQYNVIINSTD